MKKRIKYYQIIIFFIITMILCLILYFKIKDADIKNIFGNTFAGLLTRINYCNFK